MSGEELRTLASDGRRLHTRCDGPGCAAPAVATVTTGCIREHMVTADTCAFHLERGEARAIANNLWCSECGPAGQRLQVRLRVVRHDEDTPHHQSRSGPTSWERAHDTRRRD